MNIGEKLEWKSWRDIRKWCMDAGYSNVVKRMDLNNSCWNSSGEFGRCQTEICDSLRYAIDEAEAHEIACDLNEQFAENYGLW